MTRGQVVGAVVCGVLLLLGVASVVGFVTDPFGWRKERLERTETRAVTAEKQAELGGQVQTITERTHTRETIIREAAHEAVRSLPKASDPVPADLLDSWRGGIERVRQASAGPDDPGAGEPARAVSAP